MLKINNLRQIIILFYYFVLHNTILFIYLCNVKLKKEVGRRTSEGRNLKPQILNTKY